VSAEEQKSGAEEQKSGAEEQKSILQPRQKPPATRGCQGAFACINMRNKEDI